jgi:hypothetical protein
MVLTIASSMAAPLQSDGDVLAHLPATIRMDAEQIRFV